MFESFSEIFDPRTRCSYSIDEIFFGALTMDLLKCGSRNQYNNLWREEPFRQNFECQFKLSLPHADTIDEVIRQTPPEYLEEIRTRLVKHLIENKSLRRFRIFGSHYLVAVDATGIASFNERHCPHCLMKTSKNGVVSYFHYVLEAKLVTTSGLAISIGSEFIENPDGEDYDKQDCEQKAFKRLVRKIKKAFPRLPICLLANGLYPTDPVFDICLEYGWNFIITLKDNALKTFQKEASLFKHTAKPRTVDLACKGWEIYREYKYLNDIQYHKRKFEWLSLCEIKFQTETGEITENQFVYITNIRQNIENVIETADSGRLRWKIENEGFNVQKNNGYGMEHKYSRLNYIAMQNYYLILQIAHLVNQLGEISKTLTIILQEHSKATIKDLWMKLFGYLIFVEHIDTDRPPG
jgi:hypothetical protein